MMRRVIGTAPAMFVPAEVGAAELLCPAVLFAIDGAHAAMIVAAAEPPAVKRNVRRAGFDGPEVGSSGMAPPWE